jgi:hypothetical protein
LVIFAISRLINLISSQYSLDSRQKWSLSDYKRRVSSTATVKASYLDNADYSIDLEYIRAAPTGCKQSDILGIAAGGQMYGSCNLTLLID